MKQIYSNIIATIGHTPIVKINHAVPEGTQHTFFGKIEYFNPGGSVKDRIALAIIEDAEKSGQLKPGGTIVEATSGNTGVGLAMIAAIKGYKCIFVMPEKISEEKRAVLRAYGARVVMTPTGVEPEDPRSHYMVAKKFVEITPGAFYTNQYHNVANCRQHYQVTGPEIWEQTGGDFDVFVAGAGTGGTISGVGRYLKEKNPAIKIVCADPFGSILHDLFYYKELKSKAHSYLVEGIGEDMVPDNVQFQYMDDFEQVTDAESFHWCREIVRKEGIMIGPSCGAAYAGAVKYALGGKLKKPSKILVMMPDSGKSYLTKAFNDSWMRDNGLLPRPLQSRQIAEILPELAKVSIEPKIEVNATLKQAVQVFREKSVTQVPVYSGKVLMGALDATDVLVSLAEGRLRPDEMVLHVTRTTLSSVKPETSLAELQKIFAVESMVRVMGTDILIRRADFAAMI